MRKKSKMLLAAFIFTVFHLVFSVIVASVLMFNLFGVVDSLGYFLQGVVSEAELANMITSYCFELLFAFIVNFMAARFYFKGYKYSVYSVSFGKNIVFNAIMQMLFSAFIPGLLALIAGIIMINKKPKIVNASNINDLKFEAMSEAVSRLKELRDSGAISEEEFYANLNKILES